MFKTFIALLVLCGLATNADAHFFRSRVVLGAPFIPHVNVGIGSFSHTGNYGGYGQFGGYGGAFSGYGAAPCPSFAMPSFAAPQFQAPPPVQFQATQQFAAPQTFAAAPCPTLASGYGAPLAFSGGYGAGFNAGHFGGFVGSAFSGYGSFGAARFGAFVGRGAFVQHQHRIQQVQQPRRGRVVIRARVIRR